MTAIPFDLVIFDCDGVLIDSELLSVRADIECLAEYGLHLTAAEIIERYTGISLAGMLGDLEVRHRRSLAGFAEKHGPRLRRLFERELRPIAGVVALLDSLSCSVCVASSGTPERLQHALSLTGLYERFRPNIFSTVEVARGKPAPDLFLHAAAQMGAAPGRCAVIEDSVPGVTAAIAAGMTAIGFTGGGHCPAGHGERLLAAGAVVAVARMAQLLPALQQPSASATRIETAPTGVC